MHKDYDKYQQYGDIHWQWYNNQADYHFLVDDALAPFKSVAPGTVVDVGCGDGLPLSFLHDLGMKCFGVEPEYKGVELALQHNVSAEYFIEGAEKFAKRGLEFDYLFSLNTIEHLDDPAALVEIMRHVKNFGVIVTDDGSLVTQKSQYHEVEFTDESFRELFKEFNLEKIKIRGGYIGYRIWKKQ